MNLHVHLAHRQRKSLGCEHKKRWRITHTYIRPGVYGQRLGLIQFKVLHRVHSSKARLAGMYPGLDAACDRCYFSPADLTHMLWSCPSLDNYWALVFKTISEALGETLRSCTIIAIHGTPSD